MSPWLLNVYIDGVMEEVKMGMGARFLEDGRVEIDWPLVCRLLSSMW